MKTFGRITAVASCVLIASGCGGGGSTPSTTRAASSTATTAPHSGTPLATENLTIKYASSFHQAKIASSATKQSKNAAGSHRTPAFIDASPQPFSGAIEIFVDGTEVVNTTPNPYGGSNGSQTFSLPLYVTGSSEHYIVAVETESGLSSDSPILAIGETDIPTSSLTAGTSQSLGLTMLQNTEYVGLMSSSNDSNYDAVAYEGYDNVFTGSNEEVCVAGNSMTVYPFAADAAGGFAAPIGNDNGGNTSFGTGGIADPILTAWTPVSPTSGDSVVSVTGGYQVTFNASNLNNDGGVLLNFSVTSPALAIASDITNYVIDNPNEAGDGTYPGIENLYANGTIQPVSYSSLSQSSPQLVQIQVEPYCNDY